MIAPDPAITFPSPGDHLPVIGDHWRLAEGMNRFQSGRSKPGLWIPCILLDFIREPQLFQQPQDELGS
jgi:hypothetical protein